MSTNDTNERQRKSVSDELLYDRILEMCAAAGPNSSVRPGEIARDLMPHDWQSLLKRIRQTAVKQAHADLIYIWRKGKPADPDDFKGVYKLRIVPDVDISTHLSNPEINKGSGPGVETVE